MSYLKDLKMKEYTLWNLHICDILPFVHRYKPSVSSTAATEKRVDLHVHEEDTSIKNLPDVNDQLFFPDCQRYCLQSLQREFSIRKEVWSDNYLYNTEGLMDSIAEVELFHSTLLAPASIQNFALVSFIPPPIWRLSEIVRFNPSIGEQER
jgi:hypothetical protein